MRPVVCSFTGVYEGQRIMEGSDVIDLSDMRGCSMYVDEEAERIILERIGRVSFRGLHFIDNGNYHYMTRLFLSFAREEFDLVIFDNHSDDMPPALGGLKSCGSWVYDIKKENPYLRDFCHIRKRGDENDVMSGSRPLYISVDKDVLSTDVLTTNWDQGDMTKEEFFDIFTRMIRSRSVLGIDICGEDEPGKNVSANESFNMEITRLLNANGLFLKDYRGPSKA